MCLPYHQNKTGRIFIFLLFVPFVLIAEIKTWTGYGGDTHWSNPLNWSGVALPLPTDDVLLDNGDLPVSFSVILPDGVVVIRTLRIKPSPGRNIELILPSSNLFTDAFTVTGPGYGIDLYAGAIFRNASGISSGEALLIADSLIIRDGGRYIHQTRASHANSIIRILSSAPGTEQGIFDFDVPRASYTISVSNRIYGSLELHSGSFGSAVNYTCTGANPLLVRGDLRIGPGVTMSMDLSGINGKMQVDGDFIQEGGQLNLASGAGDNTVLSVKGDLYQSPPSIITETNNGFPWLELNGERMQEIALAGQISNQVGFRMNNKQGAVLRLPLWLPWKLEMKLGPLFSTASLLTLGAECDILADSSMTNTSYIDGPLRKQGLKNSDHFLFPVGKNGILRWLELKDAGGNYTVEYIRQDPGVIGDVLGAGLDHISKLEYWTVVADGVLNDQAKVELSFASSLSGGVSDPRYLNVAKFQSGKWIDGGHTGITGNSIGGSVLSGSTDFNAQEFTLASTLNLENPLPVTILNLEIREVLNKPVFSWTVDCPETPDHFDLYEETDRQAVRITRLIAIPGQTAYGWTGEPFLKAGEHFFRIGMTDIYGREYLGKIVPFKTATANNRLSLVIAGQGTGPAGIMILSDSPAVWKYEVISIQGRIMNGGVLKLREGINLFNLQSEKISAGVYIFRALDSSGQQYSLAFTQP
jgi:hypothetical protein